MKFEKFVKSLASDGIIYERGVTSAEFLAERWLASPSVLMLIPVGVRSVTASGIQTMPETIDKMIDQIGQTVEANLTRAVMPFPDGKIKDCVRVFTSEDHTLTLGISNDDYSLIERSDLCEILYTYDLEAETYEPKALLVKRYPDFPDDDEELVGIIFPTAVEF